MEVDKEKGGETLECRKRSSRLSRVDRGAKVDRSMKEKSRRMGMKVLLAELVSLLPNQSSQHDTLEEATKYLKQMQERLKQLKERRDKLKQEQEQEQGCHLVTTTNSDSTSVEVNLICETSKKSFMLHQLVAIHEQEGAQVLSVNFSIVGTKMFYTIKSEAIYSRIGIETTRLQERLKNLVFC